ncbi:hypothetical protein SEA_YDN12_28 [Streptomyces phage YDN12]|uniref:Uncharacterized protein n=1 Tax=Streptomyces phage YDN12 TaxID=1636183 RepID=A0A0E3JJC9_9CAUD|nr:hypothetical protein AVT63_gp27 [Streptomyces phage YDN12]AKA61695.1 hypothetical protein SEA_YDN12_28 [Streptomyces phage YDN12]
MARCGCNDKQQCLSTNPGNLASYDETGCLYVAEFTPLFNSVRLLDTLDVVALTSGVWTDTPMTITIPAAGTFELIADWFATLHANVSADGGSAGSRIHCRLRNETASNTVAGTQVNVLTVYSNKAGRYQNAGGSSVHAYLTTTGPTVIRSQILRVDVTSGAAVGTAIATSSLQNEGTSLRYNRLA